MECEQCGKEFSGRSDAIYCSPSCRVAANRNKTKAVTVTGPAVVTAAVVPAVTVRDATLQDYYDHPDDYAQRTAPELLNWGPYMTAAQLNEAKLKGNRVTLPGDWDYDGCGIL